jgi:hypothetical protein
LGFESHVFAKDTHHLGWGAVPRQSCYSVDKLYDELKDGQLESTRDETEHLVTTSSMRPLTEEGWSISSVQIYKTLSQMP